MRRRENPLHPHVTGRPGQVALTEVGIAGGGGQGRSVAEEENDDEDVGTTEEILAQVSPDATCSVFTNHDFGATCAKNRCSLYFSWDMTLGVPCRLTAALNSSHRICRCGSILLLSRYGKPHVTADAWLHMSLSCTRMAQVMYRCASTFSLLCPIVDSLMIDGPSAYRVVILTM